MKTIIKKDDKGNLIYKRYSNGLEEWKEYDEKKNEIHYKNSNGYEEWGEYDEKNRIIHYHNNRDESYNYKE